VTEEEAFAAAVERGAFAGMSMPYQRKEVLAEGVELYLGDCLRILPSLGAVDHVITDPPYEQISQDRIGGIKRNDGGKVTEKLTFAGIDAIRADVCRLTAAQCNGWGLFFCTSEGVALWRDAIEAAGLKYKTPMIWVKPDAMPKFNGQGAALGHENIVSCWAGSGHSRWNGGGRRGVFTHIVNDPNRHGVHPTEKPAPLMMELVELFTCVGDLICDPFAGSGTTGVAAVRLGRKFVGIEQEPRFFDVACERISKALKQGDLFIEQPKPAEQTSLPLSPTSGAA
jgi:site-specific DNA-methyltransferase (adenine-specific)